MRRLRDRWNALSARTRTICIIGGLMLFVAAVSAISLSQQSLRLDEAQSLWQTSRSPGAILKLVGSDVHVPLYHLLLHYWQLFFGNGVAVARILSLLFYLATIPALYVLGREAFGRKIGLFGALLFAISPFMNWYGNEIRMYTMLTLCAVLSHVFFLRLQRGTGRRSFLGYLVVAVIGALTHYFFLTVLLAQFVFLVFYRKRFAQGSPRRIIGAMAAAGATLVPWALYVHQLGESGNASPHLPAPGSVDVFQAYAQFFVGFQDDRLNAVVLSLWPVTVLLGFLALRRHRRVPTEAAYMFFAATVPVIAAIAVSILVTPVFLSRYLIVCLPPLYLAFGWVLSGYTLRIRQFLVGATVAAMLLTLLQQAISPAVPVREDYRGAATYLEQQATADDVIIASAPFTVYPLEYYYKGRARLETLPVWDRYAYGAIPAFSSATLPTDVKTVEGRYVRGFVLLSEDQGYEDEIRTYFDTHYQKLEEKDFSPGMKLLVYKFRYDTPAGLGG
jgi:uncharacterized membrane protein